jgi:hypothetical protein
LEALEWQQHMLITAMQYSAAKGMTFLGHPPKPNEAITAIKAALEAKDEPYAFEASMYSNDRVKVDPVTGNVSIGTPQRTLVGLTDEEVWEKVDMREHAEGNLGIGTAQPQRKPLSDEEIDKAWRSVDYTVPYAQFRIDIAKAIEAAHGIKGEA